MQVTELSAEAFWKGETEIKGTVLDGGGSYRVRILRKGSHIFDYSCSRVGENGRVLDRCGLGCTQTAEGLPMCAHGHAVLTAYLEQETEKTRRPVSTSQKIRFMVREYTNREVNRITGDEEAGNIRLVPRVVFGREEIRVRYWVGKEKLYPVKDLVSFARAVEFERVLDYGRGFSFQHSLKTFSEECRPSVLLLTELADLYMEHYGQMRKGTPCPEPVLKELVLGKAKREQFFSIMKGRPLECEDRLGVVRTLLVKEENPSFSITAERAGRDGVRIFLPKELTAFRGERCLFVADHEAIYVCDEEYTEALSVFMEYMVMGADAEHEALINDRDMPLFYERVLRRLESLKLIDARGINLEEYRPVELTAKFYFDSAGPGMISLRPELSYGSYSFHPLEDENVPREICRDVPGEFKVSRLITAFFKYTEEGSRDLVIRNDDAALYRLISVGMEQFLKLGEVYFSEEAKKIRVLPPPVVGVRVQAESGWLNLEVDTGEIPREELFAILSAYEQKKKFYRMKNGDFLTLGDDGLFTISKLARGLGTERELACGEEIRLPLYRAMFLDSILKEDKSVSYYRDQLMKAVVRGMRSVEDSDFEIPPSLLPVLRNYQKVGFRWLKTLDSYGFGGILADEMGLGKTIQVIALLLDEKERAAGKRPVSLIVCPASLVYNWENEFLTFAPGLRVLTMAGGQAEREESFERLLRPDGASEQPDVLITSYDLLKRDVFRYQEMEFRFQIIDEAQYIKNANTQAARAVKAVKAVRRFALTGTPVENHLGELWSIFDFLMPGFLFSAAKFRKNFEIPIGKEGDQEALGQLLKMTRPFIMRRLKSEVLKELPDKLETVLYSAMDGEQKRLYMAEASILKERLLMGGDAPGGREKMQILAELMKLRQICCDPGLCFSKYKGGSAKLEACMELLEDGVGAGHKILLFSQFTSMLDIIGKRLLKLKIPFYMLTGSTGKKERMQMVSSFQKDEIPIFLISLKAGGTGLNLTAADIVIHYDPWWNVAAENQATDRAHRIGQTNQVTVIKLITRHTVEENILKLQEMKKNLADSVVTEGGVSFGALTKEELLAMVAEWSVPPENI